MINAVGNIQASRYPAEMDQTSGISGGYVQGGSRGVVFCVANVCGAVPGI